MVWASLALAGSNAQTNTSAPGPVPAQVVIIGTLHGGHRSSTNYSVELLRKLIVAVKPAAILIETPPEIAGQPTVRDGRATNPGGGVENTIANIAADDLGVNVIAYDREGRQEYYLKTHYIPRQEAAFRGLDRWFTAQAGRAPDSIVHLANRLRLETIGKQDNINRKGGPEAVNSANFDMVIAAKHGILFGMGPKLVMAAGEQALAEELFFVSHEWQERNQIMARHIREIACKFAGKRLVVLTGAEHRYILRELLAKAPELEIREFYEVPEWTGAVPPEFASPARKGQLAGPASIGQRPGARNGDAASAAAPEVTLVGIGIELQNGYPDIKRLFPGSPAELCGQLHPGDRILALAQGDQAFVDSRKLGLQELVQMIRGKPGTTIRLQVLPADAPPVATPRTIALVRNSYAINR